MIKNLLENMDNTDLFRNTPYIGSILNKLGEDVDQRKIRNAIFHSDFFLEYEINWDERLITFKNFDEQLHLSAKEFLTLFFETVQLVFSFNFALEYVHFLKIFKGNEEVLKNIRQDSYKSVDYLKSLLTTQKELSI